MYRLGVLVVLVAVGPVSTAGAATGTLSRGRMPAQPPLAVPAGAAPVLVEPASPRAEVSLRLAGGSQIARSLPVWRLDAAAARRAVPPLVRAGLVRAVEPDRPVRRLGHHTAGDPLLPTQWWVAIVGADRAEPPGPGKPVTVIDSGLDLTHPEFAGRAGTEPLNGQVIGYQEGFFHGTAVSSVVAAPANGLGVVGVYPQAVIRPFDADVRGGLTTSDVVAGIDAAMRRGPGVINLSLGVAPSAILADAVNAAYGTGSIIVAAAGNSRLRGSPAGVPASLPHVLTVAATDERGDAAYFSTQSATVDLGAPGLRIPVAVPTTFQPSGYDVFDGTSFSSPLVAGATAWVWTARPTLDATQVFELMRASARDVGPRGRDVDTGFGVLDIPAALTRRPPPRDPQEPNDDVFHVKARGLFRQATAPLTSPGKPRRAIAGRVDRTEDPDDVYRVWVPGRRTLVATLRTSGNLDLALWAPATRTVYETGPALRRDLVDASVRRGTRREVVRVRNRLRRGAYFYLDVFVPKRVRAASYRLNVRTVARR